MTRKIVLLLTLPLFIPTSAYPRKQVSMQISAGAAVARAVDGATTIDAPGVNIGLGFGGYVARPLDLYLTFGYSYFPSTNDQPPVTGPFATNNDRNDAAGFGSVTISDEPFHSLDTSFGVRLMPKGDRRVSRPYFLVGLGMSWLSRGGFPGSESIVGETFNDPYIAIGIGFEGPITADTYFTFEILTKKLVDRDGAYFPITAGVRF